MTRLTVVITGATKGLGHAAALSLARGGDRVIALYSSDESAAARLRAELLPLGGGSIVLRHDVSVESQETWERPEIQEAERLALINNACAPFTPRPFHLSPWEEVEAGLDVALKGSWLCSRALLRPMARAGGGAIVNVLTVALNGLPPKGFAAYVVAKHALRGLTLALASELAAKGIRVFSVSPGFMDTALTASWDPRLVEAIRKGGAVSDPVVAAERIRELLAGGATIPGKGEDYPI